jgi:hypothetical protein
VAVGFPLVLDNLAYGSLEAWARKPHIEMLGLDFGRGSDDA